VQWIDGISMRDLVFTKDEDAISAVMFDAGMYLSILRAMKLPANHRNKYRPGGI